MITKRELDNLERSFRVFTRDILTPKAYDTWEPIILELIEQARPAEPAGAESYTDTLNDLFPWGCETESEVITELVRRLDALKDETAEWIDALQGTDAARHARLDALGNREAAAIRARFRILEKRVATVMSLVVEGDLALGARLDAFELRFPATVRSATNALDALDDGLQRMGVTLDALAERVAELEASPVLPRVPGGHGRQSDDVLERDLEQREWLRGGGAVEYDVPPKDACDIAPDKSAACTCGAGDAIPKGHDEDCPKYDAAYIPF